MEFGKKGRVVLYSSMQESQLKAIEAAFEAKHPDIDLEYFFAGGGKIIERLGHEAGGGKPVCDVVWIGDSSDFVTFKEKGMLEAYESPECAHIPAAFCDADHYFTAGRLVTMGIAWNKDPGRGIDQSEVPKTWNDLLDPKWKGRVIMTDPEQSTTSKHWMGAMMQNPDYGPAFFEGLYANACTLGQDSTTTHSLVADGSYQVGICLDYFSRNLADEGFPIGFRYTDGDVLTLQSPLALVKNAPNRKNGRLLIDFILSKEGQELLAKSHMIPVRDDVKSNVDTRTLAQKNMAVDYHKLGEELNKSYLVEFNRIWKR